MQRCVSAVLGAMLALCPMRAFGAQSTAGAGSTLAERADAAREQGHLKPAIELYREALAKDPTWQAGWWYYGSLLYDNNEFPLAAKAMRHLTSLNSGLGGAWALLGLSEYETGHYDVSLADLQKARALGTGANPDLANVVNYHLAVLLNEHGDPESANILLGELLRKGVRSADLQVALGLTLLRVPLLPAQIDPSKDALIHQAGTVAAYVDLRQYGQAATGFKELIADYPKTSFMHYNYGTMLAIEGKDSEAIQQFQEETKITPGSALPYTAWAFIESKATHYKTAEALAQKAVQRSEKSFIAYYVLGLSLLNTGQTKAAVPPLQRARELAPNIPEIRYSLSRAYAQLGEATQARHEQAEFLRLRAQQRKQPSERTPVRQQADSQRPFSPQ
jgi:tetratricopeptide (TPR) repeat protein